jgi:hypothetical protein
MEQERPNLHTPQEFTNKYGINNPYYNEENDSIAKDHLEVINNRLGEIEKKDIKTLEAHANTIGKTLIDKDLLIKLQDFDFWKEWKNNGN